MDSSEIFTMGSECGGGGRYGFSLNHHCITFWAGLSILNGSKWFGLSIPIR